MSIFLIQMIFFQSRVKSGQVNPILAKKLFVKKENRNFVSELVEPLLVPILLNVNGLEGNLKAKQGKTYTYDDWFQKLNTLSRFTSPSSSNASSQRGQ